MTNAARRAYSLDALRGYAILTMVLSATVAGGILPGWMYHAQTPPPTHEFNPLVPGLTWVDLVFPFFLFAMGAAFPFSIKKRREKGESRLRLVIDAVLRGFQLAFFAIFIQHFYPYMLSSPQDLRSWLLAILCFAVLFPMFMRLPWNMPQWAHVAVKVGAYAIAVVMLAVTDYAAGAFNLYTINIIILLLANMAVFGSIVYIFTMDNWLARIVVMAILLGITLGGDIAGSWTKAVFDYSPLPWLYKFDYLKYLFIVLPGSMAGDYLLQCMRSDNAGGRETGRWRAWVCMMLALTIIVSNLVCLYGRHLVANIVISLILLLVMKLVLLRPVGSARLWTRLLELGAALLLIGLCFEPYQGGIKKDYATISYFFVTSGLACMALIVFHVICDYFKYRRSTAFLVMSGQNPMVAYVAGDLLIMPVLNLCGVLAPFMALMGTSPWLGFLQGVVLTTLSLLVTMFFTRIKWYWRT